MTKDLASSDTERNVMRYEAPESVDRPESGLAITLARGGDGIARITIDGIRRQGKVDGGVSWDHGTQIDILKFSTAQLETLDLPEEELVNFAKAILSRLNPPSRG